MDADLDSCIRFGWQDRYEPPPGKMADIYDGALWKAAWSAATEDSDEQRRAMRQERASGDGSFLFFVGLMFDFVSPFFKVP